MLPYLAFPKDIMLLPKNTPSEKSCLRSFLSAIDRLSHDAAGSRIRICVRVFRKVWCLVDLLEGKGQYGLKLGLTVYNTGIHRAPP